MKIGIIGAGLSGLVAGKKLAKAGHDVTVIEKSRTLGGRLATYKRGNEIFDYGISSVISSEPTFESFIADYKNEGILKQWSRDFALFDGTQLHEINPNRPPSAYQVSEQGLNTLATHLSRWVDVKSKEKAGGLTHIGANRGKKRSWMINLSSISVFECDAVIIAAPAPEAYGVLQTAQDETPTRRIIRHIDEVQYEPCFSLMASYDIEDVPKWKGIECEDHTLRWIGNESSKLEEASKTSVVIRSSAAFARKHVNADEEEVTRLLLERASEISDSWLINPVWTRLHYWKYYEAINPLEDYFMELEMEEAPLALIGDYMSGNSVQSAFLSGYRLADYWISKYSEVSVQ